MILTDSHGGLRARHGHGYSHSSAHAACELEGQAPEWLAAYARFHVSQRVNDSAPTLVYSAAADPLRCTGLGDRAHGFAFALRAAAATSRVLYIHYPQPCGWSSHFAPACLNWHVEERLSVARQCNQTGVRRLFWMPPKSPTDASRHAAYVSRLLLELTPAYSPPCIAFIGNLRWPSATANEHGVGGASLADVWHHLFRPTAALQAAIASARRDVFGTRVGSRFVGIHLRLGDASIGTSVRTRKWFAGDRRLSQADAAHVLACALQSTRLPVLVATDNTWLRSALLSPNASAVLRSVCALTPESLPWVHAALSPAQVRRALAWRGALPAVDGIPARSVPTAEAAQGSVLSLAFDAASDTMVSVEPARGIGPDVARNPDLGAAHTPPPRSEAEARRVQAAELRMQTALVEMGLLAEAQCLVPSPPMDYASPTHDRARSRNGAKDQTGRVPLEGIRHSQFSDVAVAWGRLPLCKPAPALASVCWWPPNGNVDFSEHLRGEV